MTNAMNILLLGSGGREHALAWKLAQSPHCRKLFIAPGNGGTRLVGQNISIDINDFNAILNTIIERDIDMVVVGPEAPLVNGIRDAIRDHERTAHVLVVGPGKQGAQLEGSKAYAKAFMNEFGIPTAAYRDFTRDELAEAIQFVRVQPLPIVLKADGLAAGKGVLIIDDHEEAIGELSRIFSGKFGDAGHRVVIEEFLSGIEFSVFVLTDGEEYCLLPMAKDYKRIGENDTGLNTGGMGAVSPVPFVNHDLLKKVEDRIIKPTIAGLQARNISYRGFIFFGLINVDGDPLVIEYNCRMGDPETEVVIPRIQDDLVVLLKAAAQGKLNGGTITQDKRFATTVMAVSGGYPRAYEKGKVITISPGDAGLLFHAGTKRVNDTLVTNGGRVMACTAMGGSMNDALQQSYRLVESVHFEGKYFRRDIGFDLQP